jgi:hypothetical protein
MRREVVEHLLVRPVSVFRAPLAVISSCTSIKPPKSGVMGLVPVSWYACCEAVRATAFDGDDAPRPAGTAHDLVLRPVHPDS